MVDAVHEPLQILLVAILVLAAICKTATRSECRTGPLGGPVSTSGHNVVNVQVGIELALAGALLLASGVLAAVFALTVAVYFCAAALALLVRRARDPEAECGCFGGLSSSPVGIRAVARAVLLAVMAIAVAGTATSGIDAIQGMTGQQWAVAGVALLLLCVFSPEVPEMTRRLFHWDACTVRTVPMARTLARLRRSDVWRANATFVAGKPPEDVWRYGCWRLVRFRGKREGREADLVFAVPLRRRSVAVHAAFADPETGAVLATFGDVTPRQRRGSRTPVRFPDSTTRTVRVLEEPQP